MSMTTGHKTSSEMNVTPLIDVLLVLLIIFMVMPHHRGEKAEIPQKNVREVTTPAEENIVIQLLDSGSGRPPSFKINREEVAAGALEKKLTDIFRNRIDKKAFLQGDPEIEFQYVVETVDTAHRAGIKRVGLIGER